MTNRRYEHFIQRVEERFPNISDPETFILWIQEQLTLPDFGELEYYLRVSKSDKKHLFRCTYAGEKPYLLIKEFEHPVTALCAGRSILPEGKNKHYPLYEF